MTPEDAAAAQSAVQGSAFAKSVIRDCMGTPMPFAASASAAGSLLSAGFAMVQQSQSPKIADDWMTVVLSTAKQALDQHGIEVTFSFARKQR